ncbi:MAG: hypothetical protein DWQ05_16510 [Calditrichaeota bacterium]|nr:MAG: hypothetical protein DWQ05_16510 [Calditrichota bacterium]
MQRYLVLIGDVVSSKKIPERMKFQNELQALFADLNNKNNSLISPYTITLGDEFQAVFTNPQRLFLDIFSIMERTWPVRIRFSLGIGTIATQINKNQAIGMDGQAFHCAREGMSKMRRQNSLLNIKGLQNPERALIEENLNLLSFHMQKWKANRFAILRQLMADTSIIAIAESQNLTDKAIYKAIQINGIGIIHKVIREITNIIAKELKG